MPGCQFKCIRKQNESDQGPEAGQSHRAAAPVPSGCKLKENDPVTSTTGTQQELGAAGRGTITAPPNDLYHSVKRKLSAAWKSINNLWRKTEDPYNWQLLKSITMFTLALKLFNDLHRHMNRESVCG